MPSSSITAAFVVVEPASIPRKRFPLHLLKSPFLTLFSECLPKNCLYSSLLLKSGSSLVTSKSISIFLESFSHRLPREERTFLSGFMAAPDAAKRCECSGAIIWLSVSLSVRIKACRSSVRKCSGPPRNATLPRIGLPHARPLIVWFTTAWNIDADRSSFVAPSLIRGCISDLANTPQRAAIGYKAL